MMIMNEELKKDFKNSIGSVYFKIQQTLTDEDYSFETIDIIETEFNQILNSLNKIDMYKHINCILTQKRPSKVEAFFYIGKNRKISGVFKGMVFSNICGNYKKTSYELKVENYLNQLLEFLDKIIVIIE